MAEVVRCDASGCGWVAQRCRAHTPPKVAHLLGSHRFHQHDSRTPKATPKPIMVGKAILDPDGAGFINGKRVPAAPPRVALIAAAAAKPKPSRRPYAASPSAIASRAARAAGRGNDSALLRCTLRDHHGIPCGALQRERDLVAHLLDEHGLKVTTATEARRHFATPEPPTGADRENLGDTP